MTRMCGYKSDEVLKLGAAITGACSVGDVASLELNGEAGHST